MVTVTLVITALITITVAVMFKVNVRVTAITSQTCNWLLIRILLPLSLRVTAKSRSGHMLTPIPNSRSS